MKLIFMGSKPLAEGFALLGFNIFPDANSNLVEETLSNLLKHKENALVFIENDLVEKPGSAFLQARRESGRIIIAEIPHLHEPDSYHPLVEDLVARVLGPSVLNK